MEILPGIVADGCALFLRERRTLVVSDLHLGYEEELRSKGILIPGSQRADLEREMSRLVAAHKPRRVVLAGDVKHEFGRVSQEEWSATLGLLRGLQAKGCAVAVVGGNHDVQIKPVLAKAGVALVKALVIGDVLIVHGDERIETLVEKGFLKKEECKGVSTVLCGHEHPALTISDGVRKETVKCFLVGPYRVGRKKLRLVVMPSINPLTFGTDALRERPIGPLLADTSGFSAYAVLDEILAFGELEKLKKLREE